MRLEYRTAASIQKVTSASPEQKLTAILVGYAISDAAKGEKEPTEFFTSRRCLGWLSMLTPPGVDPRIIQERCIEQIRRERARNGLRRVDDLVVD